MPKPVKKRRSKLAHVARLAGVSQATASRALRGEGRVSEETAARVRAVAESLGYTPDVNAQALRTGLPSKLLALIVDEETQMVGRDQESWAHAFWIRTMFGVWNDMAKRGVTVATTTIDNQRLLVTLPVSGILSLSTRYPRMKIHNFQHDVPIFVLGSPEPDDDPRIKGYIRYDDQVNTRLVLDDLWSRGANNIALVSRRFRAEHAVDVEDAYRIWCAEHGQEPVVVEELPGDPDSLKDKIMGLAATDCDAIYAYVPEVKSTVDAIVASGRSIPEDIMVVTQAEGLMESQLKPSITTLSMRAWDAVDSVVEPLSRALNGELEVVQHIILNVSLDHRDSTNSPVVR